MKNIMWFSEIRKANLPEVGGKGANLKYLRRNVKGNAKATARTTAMFIINALLGLLFQNGTILVLIAKITRV